MRVKNKTQIVNIANSRQFKNMILCCQNLQNKKPTGGRGGGGVTGPVPIFTKFRRRRLSRKRRRPEKII